MLNDLNPRLVTINDQTIHSNTDGQMNYDLFIEKAKPLVEEIKQRGNTAVIEISYDDDRFGNADKIIFSILEKRLETPEEVEKRLERYRKDEEQARMNAERAKQYKIDDAKRILEQYGYSVSSPNIHG